MSGMGGIFESPFKPFEEGDVAGTSTGGPWFNYRGRRAECDWLNWTAPNGVVYRIGMIVPCPNCQHPHSVSIKEGSYRVGDDGELSILGVFTCPGHWQVKDAGGQLIPQRCGLVFMVREGVAHDFRCNALHQPGCPMLGGGQCRCGGAWGNKANCNCGALAR